MKARVIGKGLTEKRLRILRSLTSHIRFLETCATLGPFTPSARTWEPRLKQTQAEWAAYWAMHSPPSKVSPRERPSLAHPVDGLAEVTEAEMAAWVAQDEFVRGGLRPATIRALCYIERFAPATAR